MARTVHTQWHQDVNMFAPGSICDIARAGPSQRPEFEAGSGAEPEPAQAERMRRRVWRAVTWIVFANVFAFWLLTCITAFTGA